MLELKVTVEKLINDQKTVQFLKQVYAHTTPSFEFSVAENSQGSETKGVSDCMFLQKNQTSCHSQTDNTG